MLNMLSAEEDAAQGDAVEAADEGAVLPAFDAVGVSVAMEVLEEAFDVEVDPCVFAAGGGGGASGDDGGEGAVGGDLVGAGEDGSEQAFRQMEAVERENAAQLGVEPIEPLAAAGFGHGEEADAIGPEHQLGRDLDRPARHRQPRVCWREHSRAGAWLH